MASAWNVLVVDDAEDVHQITKLALKRKSWRGRSLALTHARSAKEAREILTAAKVAPHCALIDVVMETEHAGLELCDFIRASQPRTLRIVLRTGQPGAAPPEQVMNDYDIDYYLAKPEVTEDRLFAAIRACLRSSLDVAALQAMGAQLRSLTTALQSPSTTHASLAAIMTDSLQFLEEKYSARITFVADIKDREGTSAPGDLSTTAVAEALVIARTQDLAPRTLHPGEPLGLPGAFVVVANALVQATRAELGLGSRLKGWFTSLLEKVDEDRTSGLGVRFESVQSARTQQEFSQDLDMFIANWLVAETTLGLQDRIVRERLDSTKTFGQT